MTKSVFEIIKRQNGEAFAKSIRAFDSGLFDMPNFANIVRFAGKNAEPILYFLEGLKMTKTGAPGVFLDPLKLLDLAGYNAFYVDSLEKQNSIRKYFNCDEEICTFDDPERFKKYHVIHCVKKNVDEIKRKNFSSPKRDDAYATSVISIQISKKSSFIKITNRYNHLVENPDNTFNSDPDNIIPGLSYALEKYFGLNFIEMQQVPNGFVFFNGQLLKINMIKENIAFGNGFYIKEKKLYTINKDYEFLVENYLINLKEKTITALASENPDIVNAFQKEMLDEKLFIRKKGPAHILYAGNNPLMSVINGRIHALCFEKMTEFNLPIKQFGFLRKLTLKNVKSVGHNFLMGALNVLELDMPNLEKAGNSFLRYTRVGVLNAPKLKEVGDDAFSSGAFKRLNLPVLERAGIASFCQNNALQEINMPNLVYLGRESVCDNPFLVKLFMPALSVMQKESCCDNKMIETLSFESLRRVESNCFIGLHSLDLFEAPLLNEVKIPKFKGSFILKGTSLINSLDVDGDHFIARCFQAKCVAKKGNGLKFSDFYLGKQYG